MSDLVTCGVCGNEAVRLVATTRYVDAPDGASLPYQDSHFHCESCGDEFYAQGQQSETGRNRAGALRKHLGFLTPDEIREIRTKYGLTQAALEELLGVGAKTVVRWERGTVCQSRTADKLMRVVRDKGPDVLITAAESEAAPGIWVMTNQMVTLSYVDLFATPRVSGEWKIPANSVYIGNVLARGPWDLGVPAHVVVDPPPIPGDELVNQGRAAEPAARAA